MKKTVTRLLICAALALLLAVTLVACNNGTSKLPDGYVLVTFDYNVGEGLTESVPETQYVGVPEGGLIGIRPGANKDKLPMKTVAGYYFDGWYLPALDAEGQLQYDEHKRVILGSAWNFQTDRVSESITLYAKFEKAPRMLFVEVDDNGKENVISYIEGRPGRKQSKPSGSQAPSKEGFTFLGEYYATKECKEDEQFDFGSGDTQFTFGRKDVTVYVKFIEGTWSIVRTAQELDIATRTGANVYLMNDITLEDKTDYTDQPISNWTPNFYNGEFNGNGHTISNVYVKIEASRLYPNNYGIFGELSARANVHDVKFDDCHVEVIYSSTTAGVINVGFFAWKTSGATVKNVTITNSLLIVDYGVLKTSGNYSNMTYHPFIGGVTAGSQTEKDLIDADCNWDGVRVEERNKV